MKILTLITSLLAFSLLLLAACGPVDDTEPQMGGAATPSPEIGAVPETGEEPAPEAVQPEETGREASVPMELGQVDLDVRGAHVIPDTGRDSATLLSELLNFQVVDLNGRNLGVVDDFILNMCEAHIIYIVIEADSFLEVQGDLLVIPYEAVTLEGGVIDVDSQTIFVNFEISQLEASTAYQERIDLSTTDWETDTRNYWSNMMNLSNLTTECRVPAQDGEGRQAIVRIAHASDVLGAEVVNGIGEQVGAVEEVVVAPESGLMRVVAIQTGGLLQAGQGLAAAPPGAVNIHKDDPGNQGDLVLVLLVEAEVLENAPRIDSLPQTGSAWEGSFFNYWSQYLPMTREDLP
jgi:sporulation protein YlmC with PRC-barrel domain